MCYSARVQQHLRSLARRFGAEVDWSVFEQFFELRPQDVGLKGARALERNFDAPATDVERRIHARIQAYRQTIATKWETDLFRQKSAWPMRNGLCRRKRRRKRATTSRIGTSKIEDYLERLGTLRSSDALDGDDRIFSRYFVPIVIREGGRLLIRPMRYQRRLAGKPATYDERYPGTYNAFGAFLTVSS